MGVLSWLVSGVVVLFSAVLVVAVPLIDAQTCFSSSLYPAQLVEFKSWYAEQYGDYLMKEKPGFFLGLVWIEVLLLWPLSIANVYGILSGKRWAATTSLMAGVSSGTSMAALMGELIGSGRASNKLLQMYFPFVFFAIFAIIRGLVPFFEDEATPENSYLVSTSINFCI
ncbi:putative EXPERA domain-containing protein [Dioscorea sansibarensis]